MPYTLIDTAFNRTNLEMSFKVIGNLIPTRFTAASCGYDDSRSIHFSAGYITATRPRETHCPSNEYWSPLVSSLFLVALRCDILRAGDFLTLIVKLRIRDNAHPLSCSWNSSSDARIGSMMCCSYHSHISVHRYILLFFVIMLLLAFILRREFAVKRGVHFYTTVSFYSVSHLL